MLRIASEKNINGKHRALSFLNLFDAVCDAGRAFGVVPREECPSGYIDLQHDDYQSDDFLSGWQEIVLDTAQSIVDLV